MKDDQDLLERVSRTLRERHDGKAAPSALTRERILTSVRKQNKRRSFWFKGSIPGGMLLLGTTAWAQATHQWPVVWRTIGDVFSLPLSSEGNSEQELAAGRATQPASTSRHQARAVTTVLDSNPTDVTSDTTQDTALGIETAPGIETAVGIETALGMNSAPAEAALRAQEQPSAGNARNRRKQAPLNDPLDELPATTGSAPALELAPKEPPSEPEVAAFRAANDLDIKQRNLGQALSAYRLYLRDYPGGRFVPEARYNAAMILVKLGKRDEARRELTPFASGKYGAHRQARAVKLLEALERP